MAEENESASEKTEEPSQYRIEDFREKGQVASSKEVINIIVLTTSLFMLLFTSMHMIETLGGFLRYVMTLDYDQVYQQQKFFQLVIRAAKTILSCVGPIFAVSLIFAIFSNVIQFGFIFSLDSISLNIGRVNPLKGMQRILSKKSIFEMCKGLFKFSIILGISYQFLQKIVFRLSGFLHLSYFDSFLYGKTIITQLALYILIGLSIIAVIDFIWEKYLYKKKLLQTKQESKEELKEKEGNPEIKQRIRSIQREIANKRMMAEVPKADVIITNPTHISIAVKYDSKNMIAPQVIAKGADNIAMQIRKIAKKHDIPMVENVPLARNLYKTVKVGHVIPRNLYKVVAEILAFVYKLRKKHKALSLS